MNRPIRFVFALVALVSVLAGCAHLDVAAEGDPNRVVKGTIDAGGVLVPAGAEVLVRIVENSPREGVVRPATDLPLADRPQARQPERILAEARQTVAAATTEPIPFQIEVRADDATLRRGLNLEARISFNGRLRFRTINARVVTLASAPFAHDVSVAPVNP